jgi:hypothetical protein
MRRGLREGNSEGTPTRAPASTRVHSSSGDSFFLRGFRARGDPAVPALFGSSLNGKEGVDGSSPSEGLEEALQMRLLCCLTAEHADTLPTHLRYPRRTATSCDAV